MRMRSRAAASTMIAAPSTSKATPSRLELGHHLAGGGGVEPGIEHGHGRLGGDPADPEDRRHDREDAEAGDQPPARVQSVPELLKPCHHLPAICR